MYNSSNLFIHSQSVPKEHSSTGQTEAKPSPEIIRIVLDRDCDRRDLLSAYHIASQTKKDGRGSDISDLMPIMGLSNPATNVRLRRMSGDLKAGGLKIPILRRTKTGPNGSHLYFLNEDLVTIEDLKAVMASKNINYEQYIAELQERYLGVINSRDVFTEEEQSSQFAKDEAQSSSDDGTSSSDNFSQKDVWGSEEKDVWDSEEKDVWDSDQAYDERENTEINESELATDNSTSRFTETSKQTTSNDANLSRTVTLGEVLKIVDIATDILVEQFNKEIAKRDNRITELERQLALYQDSQYANSNHTEEILDSVRSSMLSKFGEFSSKQNGKTHN
ncbi:MAG TPA: hypothetical protein VK211_23940 [Kamptonema sp.]|nr:hypothetical protein [Kamptonema sp.]